MTIGPTNLSSASHDFGRSDVMTLTDGLSYTSLFAASQIETESLIFSRSKDMTGSHGFSKTTTFVTYAIELPTSVPPIPLDTTVPPAETVAPLSGQDPESTALPRSTVPPATILASTFPPVETVQPESTVHVASTVRYIEGVSPEASVQPESTKYPETTAYPRSTVSFESETVEGEAEDTPIQSEPGDVVKVEEGTNTGLLVTAIVMHVILYCLFGFLIYRERERKNDMASNLKVRQLSGSQNA
jgi:hypothetical protein